MPISGIGDRAFRFNGRHAYTFLEVLAVITVLGIILAVLAAPNFSLNGEKAAIQSIGRLITSDLTTAIRQARLYKTETIIHFATDGYAFSLGETEISRHFGDNHFKFEISGPVASESPSPEPTNIPEASTPDRPATTSLLTISEGGPDSDVNLKWTTDHFKGTLHVAKDGSVEWNYAQK